MWRIVSSEELKYFNWCKTKSEQIKRLIRQDTYNLSSRSNINLKVCEV